VLYPSAAAVPEKAATAGPQQRDKSKEDILNIVFIGDVVGKSGRKTVTSLLPQIKKDHNADFVIANAENCAGGFGINKKSLDEMGEAGVDFFTTGNHVWDRKEGVGLLDAMDNIVRPGNYPGDSPGKGVRVVRRGDVTLAVANVQGRVFMPPLDCPFRWVDACLETVAEQADIFVVDVHGEATSEKISMGWYLDGRASLVVGTHTHVPTSDQRVLPGGTGYVTDVGMTGSYDGVIGVKRDAVITRFLNQRPARFEVENTNLRCDYVVAEIDERNGQTLKIDHLQRKLEG
jgi:metallophosphoesterase (TIGR00282 family)